MPLLGLRLRLSAVGQHSSRQVERTYICVLDKSVTHYRQWCTILDEVQLRQTGGVTSDDQIADQRREEPKTSTICCVKNQAIDPKCRGDANTDRRSWTRRAAPCGWAGVGVDQQGAQP